MKPLRIYLADLTHIGNGVATEGFPLNIGLVASYAKKRFGLDIEIDLFKYPNDLKNALTEQTPDILGCSNYTWNSNLSYYFASMAKSLNPDTITVFGGTNYPFEASPQEKFLRKHPNLNFHVYYEGEISFSNIIERTLGVSSIQQVFEDPIPGSQMVHPASGEFMSGPAVQRIKDLDDIPSPYVSGLLDKFFDGHLTPLVETARGCPFTCNFCNAYHEYFTKVNKFSDTYVEEELTYIAKRASEVGVRHVTILDNNFGMIPRDANTAQIFADLKDEYGWPMSISAWTGKNAKERVIDVTKVLGETLSISMSVQSADEQVLTNVGRKNIKMDHYQEIADSLNAQGRPQHAEVIMPLPGETFDTHITGLNQLLDTNVSRVLSHTLQILHGTPYKDDDSYRTEHEYVTKFRVVPLDFSQLGEERIFDVEEVGVSTKSFSFEEYVEARKYLLVLDLCFSSGVFEPLKKYLATRNVKNSELARQIYSRIEGMDQELQQIFNSFVDETKAELWDTEAELIEYYSKSENYEKLVNYDAGGNVLFKHRIWALTQRSESWVNEVFDDTLQVILTLGTEGSETNIRKELDSLKHYVLLTLTDAFSPKGIEHSLESSFQYDIPAWLRSEKGSMLGEYTLSEVITLEFGLSNDSIKVLRDGFERYGTDIAGLTKLIQRAPSISLIRDVSYANDANYSARNDRQPIYGPGRSSL